MQKHEKAIPKIKITQLGQGMARSPTEIRIKGQEQTKWWRPSLDFILKSMGFNQESIIIGMWYTGLWKEWLEAEKAGGSYLSEMKKQ